MRYLATFLFLIGIVCLFHDVPRAQVPLTGAGRGAQGGGGACNPNPPSTGCMTVSSGLVGWWTFDNSQTSGSTTNDTSGNANNGTLENSPTTGVTGQINEQFTFNGTNQAVQMGNAGALNFNSGNPMSITAWVTMTSATGNVQEIVSKGFDGTNTQYEFDINASTHLSFTTFNGSTHGITSANTFPTATRTFVVATFDGTNTWNLYVNGSLDTGPTTDAVSMQSTLRNFAVASVFISAGGEANRCGCSIDDVRAYNRVLNSTEVSSIYSSGLSGKP